MMRQCAILAILLLSLDVLAVPPGYRYIGSRVVSEGRHVYWYWDADFFQVDASGGSFVARMYARNLELNEERSYVAIVRCESRTFRSMDAKDPYEAIEEGDPIFEVWRAGCDSGRAVSLARRNERLHGAAAKAGTPEREGIKASPRSSASATPSSPATAIAQAAPPAAENRTDERRVDNCIRFALSTVSQVGDAAITNTCPFAVEVVYCYKGGRGGTFDCPTPPRRMRADSLPPGATHPLPEYKRGSNNGIALVACKGEIGTVMPQFAAGAGKAGCR